VKRWAVLASLFAAACGHAAANHEGLGDAAYGRAEYAAALLEYHAAAKSGAAAQLLAKTGVAALHTGDLREAADAYRRLSALDPTRRDEAAAGLDRVARSADRHNDSAALLTAILTLRSIAPDRVTGRQALGLARSGKLEPPDLVGAMPFALAAAGDGELVDSLLNAYAGALRETTDCEAAAGGFQAVLRRSSEPKIRSVASEGLAACALILGREAMSLHQPEDAAAWFQRGATADSVTDTGRLALLGLGDARLAQGDLVGAAIAFQSAAAGDVTDSIANIASQRLNALGSAPVLPDSSSSKAP
jgi:tetratricopeptide (TPR) repeat protein